MITGRRKLTPVFQAAILISGIALAGLCLSGFLTVAKFGSAYHCDFSLLSACKVGPFLSCDRVLSSPWSEVSGYPITIAATAFYIVVLRLSFSLFFAKEDRYVERALLHCCAWAGALVCVPLAAYAYLELGGGCSYCASLYLINVALLLATLMLDPGGSRKLLRRLWGKEARGRWLPIRQTGLLFLAATLVQLVFYEQQLRTVETKPRCITDVRGLPDSRLTYTPAAEAGTKLSAEVTLAVDLACDHCKAAFDHWYEFVRKQKGALRLQLLHLPMTGHPCLAVASTAPIADWSRFHHSCQAARAVECVEGLAQGRGLAMVEELFDRERHPLNDEAGLDGERGAFTVSRLVEAALRVARLDEAKSREFELCARDESADSSALQIINMHTSFVYDEKGARSTPAIFLTFLDEEGKRLPLGVQLVGDKHYEDFDRFMRRTREQVLEMLAERSEGAMKDG